MRLSDTLTRAKRDLPDVPGPVRMYVCGPTVYDRAHIGNARPFVIGMWLRRWLAARGYDATLVHNITDINDKIYDAAPGASAELAARASEWYLEDTRDFGLGMPDHQPKASDVIPQMIAAIEELIARGYAYEVDGDVYYRVAKFEEYGQLSGQRPDQVEEQEPNARKEDARGFALWKANKPGEDTWWDSPWGRGRPGWHIECSVMAEQLLGPAFEIHGGGLDLVFPHHENEIAQSRALGHEFAQLWMHNGMLRLSGEKMAKSLGNIVWLREALEQTGRETLLEYYLGAPRRKPIDFSPAALMSARSQRDAFRELLRGGGGGSGGLIDPEKDRKAFSAVLDDDFNTAEALKMLHRWRAALDRDLLIWGLEVFGLGSLARPDEQAPSNVVNLAHDRPLARVSHNFEEADRLRDEIEAAGWVVRDVAEGPGFQLVPKQR